MVNEEDIGSSKEEMPLPTWLQSCVDDVIRKARSIENDMMHIATQYISANNRSLLSENEQTGVLAVEIMGEFHRIINSAAAELSHQGEVVAREFKSRFPSHVQKINEKIDSSKGNSKKLSFAPIQDSVQSVSLLPTLAEPSSRADPSRVSPVKNNNKNRNDNLMSASHKEEENEAHRESDLSVFEFETQAMPDSEELYYHSTPKSDQNDEEFTDVDIYVEQTQQAVRRDSICQNTIVVEKTDYKLRPSGSFVPMEKLSDADVLAATARHSKNCTENSNTGTDSEDDSDDALAKALKRLKSFDPTKPIGFLVNKAIDLKKSGENKVPNVKARRKDKLVKKDELQFSRRDCGSGSDTDSFPEDFESERNNITVQEDQKPSIPNSCESGSDTDCYLDGAPDLELDVEDAARRDVLKTPLRKKTSSDDAGSNCVASPSRDSLNDKTEKKSYYTPAVCRIPEQSDSEASDSDISTKSVSMLSQVPLSLGSRKTAKKRNALRISSSSSESDVPKRDAKPDVIDLSSESDDNELHKHSKRNTKPVYEVTTDEEPQGAHGSKISSKFRKVAKELASEGVHRAEFKNPKRLRAKVFKYSDSDTDTDDLSDFQLNKRVKYSQSPRTPKLNNKFKKELDSDIEEVEVEEKKVCPIPLDLLIEDSDDEAKNARPKGRRKIREIMGNNTLNMSTQVAELEEEERKTRLADRQAYFNAMSQSPIFIDDETDLPAPELILDIDMESKRPLVSVDYSIAEKLKPHQVNGINFMWETCFESVKQYKQPGNNGSGCILAHCMGLGKTLQTVAFVHTVLTAEPLNVRTALIITPLNTVYNWKKEFEMWLKKSKKSIKVHSLFDAKDKIMDFKVRELQRWKREGGVGIMHYDFFRSLIIGNPKRIVSDEHQEAIEECLLDPGPDLIICDEGHLLKNHQSKMSVAINRIRTKRRIVLTGTPLQNNLMEYHTMMQFVKPNLLGTRKEFANRFDNPIKNGQHKDSSRRDVTVMKRRAHVLYRMLEGCVQRRDYSILTPYLPPKHEYAIILNLSSMQKKLYNHYLDLLGGGELGFAEERIKKGFFLGDFAALSRIWSHPLNLLKKKTLEAKQAAAQKKKLKDQGEDEVENIDETVNDEPGGVKKGVKLHAKTLAKTEMEQFEKKIGQWWLSIFKDAQEMKKMEHGSKCLVLMEIVKTCLSIGDKILVFSQYLYSLDMIEEFLKQLDKEALEKTRKNNRSDDWSRWRKGTEYFRLDGSVKGLDRQKDCEKFNSSTRAKLYLISTRAGGLGINLVGANRVVLFDASFNPSNDMQGIFRVYRFGQKKPCYIYRLLAHGTMEEKVYNRQVVKLSLSGRVVDEHQIDRHFSNDELVKMYLKVEDDTEAIIPDVPKDKLLADLLVVDDFKNMIHKVVMHDTLLRNQEDEKLTDEERRIAWEEFEAEKKGRGPVPNFASGFSPYDDIINGGDEGDYDSDMDVEDEVMGNNYQDQLSALFDSNSFPEENTIRRAIRRMYPNITDRESDLFFTKVNGDLNVLRRNAHANDHQQYTEEKSSWLKLKGTIYNCLTVPGFLHRLLSPSTGGPSLVPQAGQSNQQKINAFPGKQSGIDVFPLPLGTNKQTFLDRSAPARINSPSRKPPLSLLQPRIVPAPNRITINPQQSLPRPTTNPVQPSMYRSVYGTGVGQPTSFFNNLAKNVAQQDHPYGFIPPRPYGHSGGQPRVNPIPLPAIPTPTAPAATSTATPSSVRPPVPNRRKDGF